MRTYNIFISHSWSYETEYYRLVNMLNNISYFKWKNYSIPPEKSNYNYSVTKKKMREYISNHIKPTSCILIIGGKYVNYGTWIKEEVALSLFYNKPVIGVLPWGIRQIQNLLSEMCIDIVGWNSGSILNSIKKYSL